MDLLEIFVLVAVMLLMFLFGIESGEKHTNNTWACYNAYQDATSLVDTLQIQLEYKCPTPESITIPTLNN